MLYLLRKGAIAPEIVQLTPGWTAPANAVWLDLVEPTREEELAAEAAMGLALPTRDEMVEIETSSRLYREDGGAFMTAQIVTNTSGDAPVIEPVTFVLAGDRLVTIRYIEPTSIKVFLERIAHQPDDYSSGVSVFVGLLDEVIDRLADVIEHAVAESEELSNRIFRKQGKIDFRYVMRHLGRIQQINAKIRESAGSLTRLLIFAAATGHVEKTEGCLEHVQMLQRDLASIVDHSGYLAGNITFLLDAALGMINIEQNAIIKIFSIGAVIFLPPTLIASYFGMNFEHMPAFEQRWGEPLAAGAMIASVLGALWWFRRRGWF